MYMEIAHRVDAKVDDLLFKSPMSRHEFACPACMYVLEGEEKVDGSMLLCMDGNESLKRMRKFRYTNGGKERQPRESAIEDIDRIDSRKRNAYYFLEEDEVNRFAGEVRRKDAQKSKNIEVSLSLSLSLSLSFTI